MQSNTALVEVRGISKRYPGVVALDNVSLSISAGEVVALIGENGAGKSTLMKILGGLVRPDSGEILFGGKQVNIGSPRGAWDLGISLIHQELNTLDNLDVAGNIFLGREPRKFGLLDSAKMRLDAEALLTQVGLPISVNTPLDKLSLAQQQMVEIAKALSLNAKLLIMDEPTSSLTLSETERLLQLVNELRNKGVGIVYISHRLAEVYEVADRVVALRDGKNAGELSKDQISHEAMVRLMVGRDLDRMTLPAETADKPVFARIRDLRTARYPNKTVSFDIQQGEIFCLAGLIGAGRSEVVQAIFGTDSAVGGQVELDGTPLKLGNPKLAIGAGVGLAPEDRRHDGLIVEWSIRDNLTLPGLESFSTAWIINRKKESEAAEAQSKAIGVKAPSTDVAAANLSGGNQQKVVLGKWLLQQPKLLILDEPTRGVDVGAKAEIYQIMRELTSKGVSVLMVSSDMEEVLGVSDRIAVMFEGSITGILSRKDCTEEIVMRLAVGQSLEGAA